MLDDYRLLYSIDDSAYYFTLLLPAAKLQKRL